MLPSLLPHDKDVKFSDGGGSGAKAKIAQSNVVMKWMGDCYVQGFAPALRFLQSQILCRLYKSPSMRL